MEQIPRVARLAARHLVIQHRHLPAVRIPAIELPLRPLPEPPPHIVHQRVARRQQPGKHEEQRAGIQIESVPRLLPLIAGQRGRDQHAFPPARIRPARHLPAFVTQRAQERRASFLGLRREFRRARMAQPAQDFHRFDQPFVIPADAPERLDLGFAVRGHRRRQDAGITAVVGLGTRSFQPVAGLDDAIRESLRELLIAGQQGVTADRPEHRAVVRQPVDGFVKRGGREVARMQFVRRAGRDNRSLFLP